MFLLLCFQKWPSGEVDKADDMTITCSRQTLRRWGRVQHQLGAKAMVLLAEVLLKKKSCSQSKQLGTRRRRCLHWHFAASLMDGKYLTRVTPVWVLPLHHTHPIVRVGLRQPELAALFFCWHLLQHRTDWFPFCLATMLWLLYCDVRRTNEVRPGYPTAPPHSATLPSVTSKRGCLCKSHGKDFREDTSDDKIETCQGTMDT